MSAPALAGPQGDGRGPAGNELRRSGLSLLHKHNDDHSKIVSAIVISLDHSGHHAGFVLHVPVVQVGLSGAAQSRARAHRRPDCAADDRRALQRLHRCRLPGYRSASPCRRGVVLIEYINEFVPVACRCMKQSCSIDAPLATHHDDDAGCHGGCRLPPRRTALVPTRATSLRRAGVVTPPVAAQSRQRAFGRARESRQGKLRSSGSSSCLSPIP